MISRLRYSRAGGNDVEVRLDVDGGRDRDDTFSGILGFLLLHGERNSLEILRRVGATSEATVTRSGGRMSRGEGRKGSDDGKTAHVGGVTELNWTEGVKRVA